TVDGGSSVSSEMMPRLVTARAWCVRGTGWWCIVLAVLCSGRVSVTQAQGSGATIEVRVESAREGPSAADASIPIQLWSLADPSQSWSAQSSRGEIVRFRLVPPGRYRLIVGTVERQLAVSGDDLRVDVTRAAAPASGAHEVRVTGTGRTAYGTRFN